VHAPPVKQQQQRYLHANGLPARAMSRLDVSPFLTPTNANKHAARQIDRRRMQCTATGEDISLTTNKGNVQYVHRIIHAPAPAAAGQN